MSTIQEAGRNPNKSAIRCPVAAVTELEGVYKGSALLQRGDDTFRIAVSFSVCVYVYGLKWNNAATV